jgi:ribonucleotide reductase alpha subunit
MRVIKRNGDSEEVSFDKVLNRIRKLACGIYGDLKVDYFDIAQKVCSRIYDNVKTSELDELAAHICSSMIVENIDYDTLASRIIISNHHKNTSPSFSETISVLFNNTDNEGVHSPLISSELYDIVIKNKEKLNSYIDYSRDYSFDYFGFKTLEKNYLMRVSDVVIERPQHMFMRVALGIHKFDFKDALHTYDMMSKKYFIHATPTLFNFGTPRPQGSSCFLLHMNEDSVSGIFESLKECALISKYAGGIGIHTHNIRSKGSKIRGTNGTSSGILPMLRVFNNTARYVDQAGRRAGSIAVYLEPWHADVFDFLDMKKPHGNEEERARDLFYALWIPDLFMERVRDNGVWSLMCPDECRGLSDCWGDSFKELYEKYEKEGKYIKQIRAQDLWFKVLESQIETGTPYLCYKDAANAKSNQQNLGTIKSSNLCVAPETMVLTDKGYFPIKDLCGSKVNVWNGKQFSETVVQQTGVQQKLITVEFSNGLSLRCTPYHKFYVNDSNIAIEARELKEGMYVNVFELPVIKNCGIDFDDKYIHEPMYYEPTQLHRYNLYTKLKWIQYNFSKTNEQTLQIHVGGKVVMQHVLLMLQTLGIAAESCRYDDNIYKIEINPNQLDHLFTLGFEHHDIQTPTELKNYCDHVSTTITAIHDNLEEDDTYCFNEPLEHKGVFNGILTGQCSEIMEYTSPDEIAVCNLASICLPTFVEKDDNGNLVYNFQKLHDVAKTLTKNLNKVIDGNFYPIDKARVSNFKHRPIGIGVQGLADAFVLMRYPFDSEEAKNLNKHIFETIYHGAVQESMEIAKKRYNYVMESLNWDIKKDDYINSHLYQNEFEPDFNSKYPGAYSTFDGSPASVGNLQFDLWGVTPSNRYDWDTLKSDVMKYGMRNSLLLSPMPTASTSQIMGFNEAFEPFTSNIYKRKTMAGEFVLVNKYLIKDLTKLGLWTKDIRQNIIINEGSIQNIEGIPEEIRILYKVVWEISQKTLIDMAADRGAYVCQSQSMNLFLEDPDFKKLSSMHFYAWQKGLKTGIYYLRTKPKAKVQQFTIAPEKNSVGNLKDIGNNTGKIVCNAEDGVCLMCSS